jgi:UDP-glucose 4-epimerase
MRFLITGGAGFIGSHLADFLISRNHEVIVLDNFSTGSHANIAHLASNPLFQVVTGDITNEFIVDKFVEKADAVFHLAAAVGVNLIINKPLESLTTNIRGTEIVLEMAHRYRKKVLITSTSEIYGKNSNGPLKEEEDRILGSPLKSRWSYSTSKAVDEILAYAYWKEKNVPTVIVRLFNTVGPRQTGYYGMVIPRFVTQALADKPLTVYGDGKQTRCFLHVKDAIKAMSNLIEAPSAEGQAFNIGSQEEISIKDLALLVKEIVGSKSEISYIPYNKAYEEGFEDMPRRVPDIKKINALTGFKPTFSLKEIVQDVVRYYRKETKESVRI